MTNKKKMIIWTLISLLLIVVAGIFMFIEFKNQNCKYYVIEVVFMILLTISLYHLRISLNDYMEELSKKDKDENNS